MEKLHIFLLPSLFRRSNSGGTGSFSTADVHTRHAQMLCIAVQTQREPLNANENSCEHIHMIKPFPPSSTPLPLSQRYFFISANHTSRLPFPSKAISHTQSSRKVTAQPCRCCPVLWNVIGTASCGTCFLRNGVRTSADNSVLVWRRVKMTRDPQVHTTAEKMAVDQLDKKKS